MPANGAPFLFAFIGLVVIVLLLLVASRIVVSRTQRHSESARGTQRRRPGRPGPTAALAEPNLEVPTV